MSRIPKITVEPVGNGKYVATASDEKGNWSSSTWCDDPETAKSVALSRLQYGFHGTVLNPNAKHEPVSSHNNIGGYYSNDPGYATQKVKRNTSKKTGGGVDIAGWIVMAILIAGIVFFILNPV